MKIDIFYHPVYPKIRIKIDDKPIDENDIYGFLYPVRDYLLQTWLPESGSWHGFVHELRDITRGEPTHIIFHGRGLDYEDFYNAVQGVPGIAAEHRPAEYVSICGERLMQAERLLMEIIEGDVVMERDESEITRRFIDLYPDDYAKIASILSESSRGWLCEITSRSDAFGSIGAGTCCLIDGDTVLSDNDYTVIDQLTSSLGRSCDMLVCRFRSKETGECFAQYNEQLKKYSLRIVFCDTEDWKDHLNEKYGIPYEYRQKLTRLRSAYDVVNSCIEQADRLPKTNTGRSDAASIRNGLKAQYKKRWCSHQSRSDNIKKLRCFLFKTDYMEQESVE